MDTQFIQFPTANTITVCNEDIAVDAIPVHSALIRSECSIISTGTELARLQNLDALAEDQAFPCEPGYGVVGVIEKVGAELTAFSVGDRIFFAGNHRSLQIAEHGHDHQWSHFFPVPHDLDPVEACMACMAQISITAPHISDIKLGDSVAVFGLGLVGNLAAQMYALRGATVIGIDPIAERCAVAKACGITSCLDVSPAEQVSAVMALSQEKGLDICVDAVGHSAVINNCIQCCTKLGQVVLLGTPRTAYESNVTDFLHAIHVNGICMRGAHMWHFPLLAADHDGHSVENNYRIIFDLILKKQLRVRELISHVIVPKEVPDAYRGLMENPQDYTAVVIDWRQ